MTDYGTRSRREEGIVDALTNLILRKDLREGVFKKMNRKEIEIHLGNMRKIIGGKV